MTMKAIELPWNADLAASGEPKLSLGQARKKFETLRKRYLEARKKHEELDDELGRKAWHRPGWRNWLGASDRRRLETLQKRADKISDAIFDLLKLISPRDWYHGTPAHWIAEKLTFEDAIRPTSEPLSVTPPIAYGHSEPMK